MIAIISDIHGNLEALESVLADAATFNVDGIYCLGDLMENATKKATAGEFIWANDGLPE